MKALRLKTDSLYDNFFENARLLGITASLKNYQFCWQLNKIGYAFRLNPQIEIHLMKKNRSYYFEVYEYKIRNNCLTHYIYHNHNDGEYLLPEFKHMDFIWLMKEEFVDDKHCAEIIQSVKNISGVQLVAELTNEQIKNKGNTIF
jgi:hypothetical protein